MTEQDRQADDLKTAVNILRIIVSACLAENWRDGQVTPACPMLASNTISAAKAIVERLDGPFLSRPLVPPQYQQPLPHQS